MARVKIEKTDGEIITGTLSSDKAMRVQMEQEGWTPMDDYDYTCDWEAIEYENVKLAAARKFGLDVKEIKQVSIYR